MSTSPALPRIAGRGSVRPTKHPGQYAGCLGQTIGMQGIGKNIHANSLKQGSKEGLSKQTSYAVMGYLCIEIANPYRPDTDITTTPRGAHSHSHSPSRYARTSLHQMGYHVSSTAASLELQVPKPVLTQRSRECFCVQPGAQLGSMEERNQIHAVISTCVSVSMKDFYSRVPTSKTHILYSHPPSASRIGSLEFSL